MMSKFYGEVLGLKQVTDEKGWRKFAAAAQRLRCIPARHRRAAKVRRFVFYANDVAAFVAGVARPANQAAPAIVDGLAAPRSGFIAALFNHSSSEVSP